MINILPMINILAQTNPFGAVSPPKGISQHGTGPEGLFNLLGIGLRLFVVVAGIYALVNIILAGYGFMSAGGDSKAIEKAWGKIWQSLVGLLLVAGAFVITAVISQIIFGDPDVILNPSLILPLNPRSFEGGGQ